jgi:hypothetical protein
LFRNASLRTKVVALAVSITALAAPMVALAASPASADGSPNPLVTTASTATQSSIAPGDVTGNLTGLHDGDAINLSLSVPAADTTTIIDKLEVRLCQDLAGAEITLPADFSVSSGNCRGGGTANYQTYTNVQNNGKLLTASYVLNLGTDPSNAIVCDVSHPCDLWLRESMHPLPLPQDDPAALYAHYNLAFAAPATNPGAPVAQASTGFAGTGAADLHWTAPASDGNSPIDKYIVTPLTPSAGAPFDVVGATTTHVSGLTNFATYTYSVAAHNTAGFTSSTTATVTATPVPSPKPIVGGLTGGAVSGSPATGSVNVAFTAGGSNPNSHTVSAFKVSDNSAVGTPCTVSGPASGNCSVTNLPAGIPVYFTVTANYTGGTLASDPSQNFTLLSNNGQVQQVFSVTRPEGALVIGEACSSTTPGNEGTWLPEPTGAVESCGINLGTAVLNANATYYERSGSILPVTVKDTRSTDAGWHVTTHMSDFAIAGGASFPACNFGLHATVAGRGGPTGYTQSAVPGTGAVSDPSCPSGGFSTDRTITTAAAGGGFGYADINGSVAVQIPVTAPAGTYQGTLTFTLLTGP